MDLDQFDKLPPHDISIEQCLLASAMINADVRAQCRANVRSDHFYQPDHGLIWDAICRMEDARQPADVVLLRAELEKRGRLAEIGGSAYLGTVLSSVPSANHGPQYAAELIDLWKLRESIRIANDTLRSAYQRTMPGSELLARLAGDAAATAASGDIGVTRDIGDLAAEAVAKMKSGGVPRYLSGLPNLDARTGGFGAGEFIIIAARPSMGKSMVSRWLAWRMATNGAPSLTFSREESGFKIAKNLISAIGSVSNSRLRKPELLSESEWGRVQEGADTLAGGSFRVNERHGHIDQICAVAAGEMATHGTKIVVVDHIGLVEAPGKTAYDRMSYISRKLAALAHDTGLCVIGCCQLNRSVTQRDDKRPTMGDLRDAGTIEENADAVLMLHREDYYHLGDDDYQFDEILEVLCEKYRDGERGWGEKFKTELKYQRFSSKEEGDDVPNFN